MGMIFRYLFVFIILLPFYSFSQVTHDTIYFTGKTHVKHVVKGGESLNSIAQLHNVTAIDIRDANELSTRLYYNQLLYIPIYLNETDDDIVLSVNNLIDKNSFIDTTITNIALIMPYYLLKNDTMFNNSKDSLEIYNSYYSKSEAALSFHVGVKLALDSLRKLGKKIVLHSFDSNKDSNIVENLVYSNQLNDMDIIIGPMYSYLFEILCRRYGFDDTKILISPLSRVNTDIKNYTSVYQISLTNKVQIDIIFDYLVKQKMKDRIVVIYHENQLNLATYLKYKFNSLDKEIDIITTVDTHVDSIRRYFEPEQIVILLSRDRSFTSRMLASIGGIDSISTVFASESILSYDNLDITNLMELNVHLVSSKIIDYSNNYNIAFMSLFERVYETNSRKYSKIGYDIIMHFCGAKDVFEFKRLLNGYYENTNAFIYRYNDYKILKLK